MTESPLWIRAERDKGISRWLRGALRDEFTRSALTESGDFIAALQNDIRYGASRTEENEDQVSH